MFRPTQGGWAVPLGCENPTLISWLGLINTWQQKLCSVLRLECSTGPILELKDCNNKWSPLTIFGVIASIALVLCLVALVLCRGVGRWYKARHGSLMVATASAGAAAVRKKDPAHYPAAPHAYYRLADHELHAPLLCAACFERVEPNNLFQRGSCCEICGVIAHEGCVKQAPEDCRPITLPADKILHSWKAAGTVMTDTPEEHAAVVQHCLYCRQPCETDMFSVEPMWCCSSCTAVCHMRCYQELHPDIPSADLGVSADSNQQPTDGKAAGSNQLTNGHHQDREGMRRHRSRSVEASVSRDVKADGANGTEEEQLTGSSSQGSLHQQPARKKHQRRRSAEGDMGLAATDRQGSVSPSASLQNGLSPTSSLGSTSKPSAGALRAEKRTSSFSAIMAALSSVVSGSHETVAETPTSNLPHHRLEEKVNVERLDVCHLGHHRRLVLPPTCTRVLPSATWTSRAKSLLNPLTRRSKGKSKKGGKGSSASDDGKSVSDDLVEAASAVINQAGKGKEKVEKAVNLVSSGNQRRSSWWGPSELQWQDYRIEDVPARSKPLLVFVNTKSGPMLGHTLRRSFLRVLNPLQVVELPRESPEQALRLFAGLTNLRLLVIGGDGSAAWILSCLDSLKAEMEDKEWVPPAMALLPLGTGNDLARCLNWGGGLGAFHSRGISAVLQDVEQSTVALLDRWNITIAAQPVPGKTSSSRNQLKRTASKLQGRKEEPDKAEKKAMNNYLGIGVDAKAALEFHHLRTAYPNWFRSQIGNKLWYTGLGAKEIVQHSVRRISKRLQVVCDGEPLELPDDIEGVLILNINSYMGGVDLWASGFNSTVNLKTGKQSLCDGMLEVVGVYGSWHLGQLQVGLSKAKRLCQCSSACITTLETLAMQIDGEPWQQAPARLDIAHKGQALMLKRLESEPLARMAHTVSEVLDHCVQSGTITASQRHTITTELAAKLHSE